MRKAEANSKHQRRKRLVRALFDHSKLLIVSIFVIRAGLAPDDCCAGKEESLPPIPNRVLRVTADPNNLPFTNERREGFENKLAELIAKELGADLQYSWRA